MNICLIGAGRIGIVHAIAIASEKNAISRGQLENHLRMYICMHAFVGLYASYMICIDHV